MSSNTHQLPPPPPPHQQSYQPQRPQQQEQYYPQSRPEQRPRATSNFSFHSRKSSGSGGGAKLAPETHEEKEQRRLHTKADPSMALNEAEPSAIATERASLASLRGLSFKDSDGNLISEPDRSNPTRSRWERPLDTIRSFEAAIDGNYKRQSYMRSEASDVATNRRSSYYGGTQVSMNERPRQYSNGYYGNGRMSRPESYMDRQNGMGRGDSYYDSSDGGPSNGYVPNRARYPRTASEPQFNPGQGVYPAAGAQHSYETVTTASGSGSSAEHNGYSTDPSSENSSVDRITPLREDGGNYGFNGYGNTNSHLNNGYNQYNMSGASGVPRSSNQGPPPPPHSQSNAPPRVPVKLGKTISNTNEKPAPAEKRKSWFGKRFSKN